MFFDLHSKWLVAHRVSQYLMLILVLTTLFIPLLYTGESDAAFATVAVATLIVTAAGVAVTVWIYLDGICDSCGDGRESDHLKTCENCKALIYNCPTVGNQHIAGCGHCGNIVYHCDIGDTTKDHSLQTCDYCSNSYIPCIRGNEHGYGICNNNNSGGLQVCGYCSDLYRPDIRGNEHGYGICNNNNSSENNFGDDSSGNNSSGDDSSGNNS